MVVFEGCYTTRTAAYCIETPVRPVCVAAVSYAVAVYPDTREVIAIVRVKNVRCACVGGSLASPFRAAYRG